MADPDTGDVVHEQYFINFLRGVTTGEPIGQAPSPHRLPDAASLGADPAATTAYGIDTDQTYRYAEASGDHSISPRRRRGPGRRVDGIIVHGLCTMAFAAGRGRRGVRRRPGPAGRLAVRFSRPMYPGHTMTTTLWAPAGRGLTGEVPVPGRRRRRSHGHNGRPRRGGAGRRGGDMSRLAGRVAIVTGAGRGLGRAHARYLASRAPRWWVNDRGGDVHGRGDDLHPRAAVVEAIRARRPGRGQRDDVSGLGRPPSDAARAVDEFGELHVLVNNAGILRDRALANMSESDWDACSGAPQGPRRADPARDGVLARQAKAGHPAGRVGDAHHLDRRVRRRLRPGQLRRGQERRARPSRVVALEGARSGALQRGVAVRADPDHDDPPGRRARRRGRVGPGRPAEPGQRLAADRLAGRGEVPGQRAGVPHLRQPGHRGDDAVDRGRPAHRGPLDRRGAGRGAPCPGCCRCPSSATSWTCDGPAPRIHRRRRRRRRSARSGTRPSSRWSRWPPARRWPRPG